jgi:hypothetical protein
MQTVRSIEPTPAFRDRLSMRLALLFVGTVLAVLILLMAWTMFGTLADRREAAANADVGTPVIVIDPKIQTELAKALAFDALPGTAEVQNPFVDRANLAGAVVASTAATTSGQTSAGGATTANTAGSGGNSGAGGQNAASQGAGSLMAGAPDAYNVRARYYDWLERKKRGEFVGPESEVLVVEDLVPVGYASGGDRPPEVMLFSFALCRTFSFAPGTTFYNGSLYGFDPAEVVFVFQNGLRRKSYSDTEPCQPNADPRMGLVTAQSWSYAG